MTASIKQKLNGLKEALKRIKVLVSMQLKNLRKKSGLSKGRTAVSYVVSAAIIVLITVVLCLFYKYMIMLFQISFILDYRFLMFYIAIMQITSFISCTAGMMQTLFLDHDNSILLSFPCRHSEVFLSKLIVFFISELKKSLYGILPLLLTYGITTQESILSVLPFNKVVFFVFIPIAIVFLSLIPVLFGSVIALPAAIIKRFIQSNSIVKIVSLVLFFAMVYVGVFLIVKFALPDEIPIITRYIVVIESVEKITFSASAYTLYCRFFVLMLFNSHPIINLLLILLIVIVGVLAATLIIMPFFFSIASHSLEQAVEKPHKSNSKSSKTIFGAFVRKEFLMTTRDLGRSLSSNLLLIFMPPIVVFTLAVYQRMALNESLAPFLIYIFGTLFVTLLSLTNNSEIATAITREGSEFVLVKTAPNKTERITWAKYIVQAGIFVAVLSISYIFLYLGLKILGIEYIRDILPYLYIISLITNLGIMFKALERDIRDPRLQEYASTGSIKENKNVNKTLVTGLFAAIVIVLIYAILNLGNYGKNFIVIIPVALVFFAYCAISFKKRLYAFFDDIEL